jgi:hypothetical protein
MNNLPKSITWTGYGKSRLSKVTYPSVFDEELLVDDLNNTDEWIEEECYNSSFSLIRSPLSIKNYKRIQPVLIVRRRCPVNFDKL